MPTYYSNRVKATGVQAVQKQLGLTTDVFEFSPATALVNSDVIKLVTVPKGAKIINIRVGGKGIQSGTDSVFALGDAADDDRFGAGYQTLRSNVTTQTDIPSAGVTGGEIVSGAGYEYTADTDLELKITTAGTGQTTGGKIFGVVQYYSAE